jgi:hypothetical protein
LAKSIPESEASVFERFFVTIFPNHPTTNEKKRAMIGNRIKFYPIIHIISMKKSVGWKMKIVPNLHGLRANL